MKTLELNWQKVEGATGGRIGTLSLNRPETANAFNADMMRELSTVFEQLQSEEDVRLLILRGAGKHFSAGADLNWMKDSANLGEEGNLAEAEKMASMFGRLYGLPFPTLAVVHGAAYGGATGLTACCDLAIATEDSKFCLSEVRLGILPAVILPYLTLKMNYGRLKYLSMTARPFKGKEACEAGLVDLCCSVEALDRVLLEEVNAILSAGPGALRRLKALQQQLMRPGMQENRAACQAIARARSGGEAQAGFRAFFAREAPPWAGSVGQVN